MYDLSVSHSVEPAALQSAIATTAVPAALFSGFKPQPSPTTPTVQTRTYTTPHRALPPMHHTHSRATLHTHEPPMHTYLAGGDVRPLLTMAIHSY